MNRMNAFSLFSSAGIGELYLHKGNLRFVGANELIQKRAECYSFFYPETKMFTGSITDDELKDEMISFAREKNVKVLYATPPCQGFSSVGKNKVQEHFELDRRNFLVLEIFDFIDKLDLDYILIENVPRFLKMYFPYQGELLLLQDILLKKYGDKFNISFDILDARNYGISQSRPRAIIKLWKKDKSWENPKTEPEIPLIDVIGELPSIENGERSDIKWHYAPKIRMEIAEALAHTETGKSAIPSIQEQQTVTALKSAREEGEKQGKYILDWNREARIVFPEISRIAVGSVREPAGTGGDTSTDLKENQIAFIYLNADMDEASRHRLTEWISDKAKNRVEVHFLPEVPPAEAKKG